MKTTKRQYIAAHPKSMLAYNLKATDWPDDTEIIIGSGLIAPINKTSNLYRAIQMAGTGDYVLGGHKQRGTEGWAFAVRCKYKTLKGGYHHEKI